MSTRQKGEGVFGARGSARRELAKKKTGGPFLETSLRWRDSVLLFASDDGVGGSIG